MRKSIKHLHIDAAYLTQEYVTKQRSAYEIAQENGVRAKFIIERLIGYGITPRNIRESNSNPMVIEKRKKTCIKKYGVDNVSRSSAVLEKIKQNTDYDILGKNVSIALKKRTPDQWIESGRKRAITLLQKYGVDNVARLPETRRKMRLGAIQRVQNQLIDGGQVYPSYNMNACQLIDEYGKKNGYDFQHALNGGEFFISHLGYWVDGYDKEKNVVIEVDEQHHFNAAGKLRERDVYRQNEIQKHLGCDFIRIQNTLV